MTDEDEITIAKTKYKFIASIKKIKRERSRSHSPKIKTQGRKSKDKTEKTNEENSLDKAYIKSEIVWNAVKLENKNKTDKFLRLMGAKKKSTEDSVTNDVIDKKLNEKISNQFKNIENDLTKQFYSSYSRQYNNIGGLGSSDI